MESFKFHRMRVTPRLAWGVRSIKVAFDGEVCKMRGPLEFQVAPRPLYLLKPWPGAGADTQDPGCT